jgi:GxxExxY protein
MDAHSPEMRDCANQLSQRVIGASIEVHKHLGPGLLESAYEACLCRELTLLGIAFERQLPLPVSYKGLELDCSYRIDVMVEGLIIVELKAVDKLEPIHDAQLLTYLKLTNRWLGLLVNFNVTMLRNGVRRLVQG